MDFLVSPKERWEEIVFEEKTFLLLIGVPGAGKTTFVSWEVFGSGRLGVGALLNPDELLFEEGVYRWSGPGVRRAWEEIQYTFLKRCKEGGPIVLDATMGQAKTRGWYLRRAKEAGYRCIGLYFPPAPEVLRVRNLERSPPSKRLPEERLREFIDRFEAPALEEGFDEMFTITAREEDSFRRG